MTGAHSHNTAVRRINGAMLGLLLTTLTSCAVNPATGKRQLVLIGEGKEISMGREADPQIVEQMGLYQDEALQQYISSLGKKLAATSERPKLPWTFRLIDDPVVNAFALPGGFIYITRGILANLTSEAQLAGVMGHEIGHVTARHSVEQMSRAQLAQVGLGVGMVLRPELQPFANAASSGLGLLFLKFGRDDEKQADDLGLRYMMRAGYDPRPLPNVFRMLDKTTQLAGGRGTPEWLSTHPNPANRSQRLEQEIAALNQPLEGRTVADRSFLRRLDGLIYGPNPREGYFENNLYLHPDLEFQVRFPEGWTTVNQKQGVLAVDPKQNAVIQVTLERASSAESAARSFYAQRGVTGPRANVTEVNGLPAVEGDFRLSTDRSVLAGSAVWVEYQGQIFQVLGYSSKSAWSRYAPAVRASIESFARLTDQEALAIQPRRIKIVTLNQPMTFRQFYSRFPTSLSFDEAALINQVGNPDARMAAGTLLKQIPKQ